MDIYGGCILLEELKDVMLSRGEILDDFFRDYCYFSIIEEVGGEPQMEGVLCYYYYTGQ